MSVSMKPSRWVDPMNVQLQLFTQRQNLRLVQIERICRQQNKCNEILKFGLGRVENIVGKGENSGYKHFLLFPRFSNALCIRVVKSRDCVVKS